MREVLGSFHFLHDGVLLLELVKTGVFEELYHKFAGGLMVVLRNKLIGLKDLAKLASSEAAQEGVDFSVRANDMGILQLGGVDFTLLILYLLLTGVGTFLDFEFFLNLLNNRG